MQPLQAMTAPTDKSISPLMMTNVIPVAAIINVEVCRKMCLMLMAVKKRGWDRESTIHKPINPIRAPYCRSIS